MKHRYLLAWILLCAWGAPVWAVTSFQYVLPGTPVEFSDAGQPGSNVTWTLANLQPSNGRVSNQYDKGAGAQPAWWSMVCRLQLTGTNVSGATVEFYVVHGDGSDTDGALGTTDAVVTASDKRRNLHLVGALQVDQNVSNVTMVASFRQIYIPERRFSLFVWNATGLPLRNDTTVHQCQVTPMPTQMQ